MKAVWKNTGCASTHTNRRHVKPGASNKLVNPAWVRRNGDGVAIRYSYWDGDTEHHPGKWVAADANDLRAAKRAAKKLVEDGTAKHGCRVFMVAYAWDILWTARSFYEVWTYGRYDPKPACPPQLGKQEQ